MCLYFWPSEDTNENANTRFPRLLESNEVVQIINSSNVTERNSSCAFHTCINVYRCGYNDETKVRVYIYPIKQYLNEAGTSITALMSREFGEILQTIVDSPFYTADPDTACLFVPSIDLLNQNRIFTKETGKVLSSLPL